jgi:hypothetical protein
LQQLVIFSAWQAAMLSSTADFSHTSTTKEKAMSVREIGLIITVVIIAYAAYRLWKAFNSPDGERYLKRRVQGPFVPLTKKDIASDEARKP